MRRLPLAVFAAAALLAPAGAAYSFTPTVASPNHKEDEPHSQDEADDKLEKKKAVSTGECEDSSGNCREKKVGGLGQLIGDAARTAMQRGIQESHVQAGEHKRDANGAPHGQALNQALDAQSAQPAASLDAGNRLTLQQYLAYVKAQADSYGGANPERRAMAQELYRRMADRLDDKPGATFSESERDVFKKMLDIESNKRAQLRELRDRQPPLSDAEYEAAKRKVIEAANKAMDGGNVPHGDAMMAFHKAYEELRAERQDRRSKDPRSDEPDQGRPSRGHIDDMLRTSPRNADVWSMNGADLLARGDAAAGRAALDQSISLGGTPEAFHMRGNLRVQEKDYAGAYKDALEALKLNPGDKNALHLLKSVENRVPPGERQALASGGGGGSGGAAANAGASASPASGFASWPALSAPRVVAGMTKPGALASAQKLSEAHNAYSLGDLDQVLALARRALELDAANADAHSLLARAYAQRGDYAAAVRSASAGLALRPRSADLLNTKAFAENRLKQWRDALATSNGAIEADAGAAMGYANRAHAYGGLGDKAAMLADIRRAVGIDPSYEAAAAKAASLQLPTNDDVLFLFPGEGGSAAPAAAPAPRRNAALVVGAGLVGGLLLALGLLSTVLAPVKESVVSAFTKATRRGPALRPLEVPVAEPETVGLIRGQYEIVRQIGAGGMGMVYEGTDRSLGRRVAIKKMRDELRVNARERERFVIEAKTVAALRHPNVVDIYTIAEEGDDVYLVFEYVQGKTVHDVIQAQGRLRPEDAARVTRAMGEALGYAHARGVIHRDVKPSNVMIAPEGTVKVMDFGIARMAKDAMTRYSMTNTVVGTPPYMAPEQEQGVVRKESDVYALAVCAYEMLTGKLPFIGLGAGMLMNKINMNFAPPSRAIAGLPAALDEVFAKAFQADPDKRYRSPQEFTAALDAALGGARASRPA